jgi:hypothetical protein
MMHRHIGNGKVTEYIEMRICFLISFAFLLFGFVAGFFIGGVT